MVTCEVGSLISPYTEGIAPNPALHKVLDSNLLKYLSKIFRNFDFRYSEKQQAMFSNLVDYLNSSLWRPCLVRRLCNWRVVMPAISALWSTLPLFKASMSRKYLNSAISTALDRT